MSVTDVRFAGAQCGAAMDAALDGYVQVRIPESWEFWAGMYDAGVETGIPFVPATQPDPVDWLNERMQYWTEQPA
jgi:hypothetical protein